MSPALLLAALALGAADGGTALFQPLAFEQRTVPGQVRLGDPFVYELQITHPAGHRYELRAPRELGDLELTGQERSRADQADQAVTTFRLRMAAFQLGKQRLPDLVFDVVSPEGSGTFETHGPEVEITPTLSESAAQNGEALYDIQPPAGVPVRTYRLLWAAAALVAAGALGYAAFRWLKRPRKPSAAKVIPLEPVDVRARRALEELRAQDLPGQGRFREFHFRLSEILRGYLGERYAFDALESTSFELLDQLRRRHTPGLDFSAFERQVHASDLVKFARGTTTPEDCKRELELAYQLVQSTTAALAPPPSVPRPPPSSSDAVRPLS
ncbi:MAG TPA: hypothetical protein VND93_18145 [Myxococcales bacterium]|nr:hypothetical protein [Myxococcales bacterium]